MNFTDEHLERSFCWDEPNNFRAIRSIEATPIILAAEDEMVRVVALTGGRQFKNRLNSMGLLPGEPIRIIRNSGSGPLVLEVKGSRLAVGRGEGAKILVNRTDELSRS
jgi:ferrous iron transport protein A